MRIATLIILAAVALPASAEVYRWTDAKGVVHYTDKPPAADAKPVELPPLQTFSAGPAAAPSAPDTAAAPVPTHIAITEPTPAATIRDPEGNVSVVVDGAVDSGQGLIYLLDGKPQNAPPTPSSAYLITGVERGEHQISASLVDANGHELARAAAVTIFMMPSPVIRRRR
ncbi:MAG: DUF4124 domain-containing protein [Nevskia sp.]|jgi:hypothetical protein|nr:DUF4124 domain-containing protein [Nevskia sp.]MCK9383093.1 DUF4124 domain-containing protein [Nevskia sp.]